MLCIIPFFESLVYVARHTIDKRPYFVPTILVSYRDASIRYEDLPIGVDAWFDTLVHHIGLILAAFLLLL